MLCSRLLKPHDPMQRGWETRLTDFIDRAFERCAAAISGVLHGSLNYLPVTVVFALIVLGSIYFLYTAAKTELAPQEDQGVVISHADLGAERHARNSGSSIRDQVYEIFCEHPEAEHVFQIDVPGQSIAGHGVEALGPADRHDQRAAADACSRS